MPPCTLPNPRLFANAPLRSAKCRPAIVAKRSTAAGSPASDPKSAASCRNCPRRASCRVASQASAATEPVWPTSSLSTVRLFKSQMRIRSSLPPVASVSLLRNSAAYTLAGRAASDMSTAAAGEIDDVDHDVVAGRGEPLAVRREGQRANALPARWRCRARARRSSTFQRRICPLRPATAIRVAVGREGNGPHVGVRAIELLRDLAGRGVDDFERVREADDRELLAVRMERNGRDARWSSSGVSNVRSPVAAFHRQTVRSFAPEASVWPSGEKATERTQSPWPSSRGPDCAGSRIPNPHAGGRRSRRRSSVPSGDMRDAGDDGRAAIVIRRRIRSRGPLSVSPAQRLAKYREQSPTSTPQRARRANHADRRAMFSLLSCASSSSRSLAGAGGDSAAHIGTDRRSAVRRNRRHNPSLRVVSTGKAARPKRKSTERAR